MLSEKSIRNYLRSVGKHSPYQNHSRNHSNYLQYHNSLFHWYSNSQRKTSLPGVTDIMCNQKALTSVYTANTRKTGLPLLFPTLT